MGVILCWFFKLIGIECIIVYDVWIKIFMCGVFMYCFWKKFVCCVIVDWIFVVGGVNCNDFGCDVIIDFEMYIFELDMWKFIVNMFCRYVFW